MHSDVSRADSLLHNTFDHWCRRIPSSLPLYDYCTLDNNHEVGIDIVSKVIINVVMYDVVVLFFLVCMCWGLGDVLRRHKKYRQIAKQMYIYDVICYSNDVEKQIRHIFRCHK